MSFKESTDDFIKQCKRVIRVSKKPDAEEYGNFIKVAAIGILIIGAVGFVVVIIGQLLNL
ncbi:MAG: protein translocase SEC61 complex subunit gamma [Methanobacteriaceae archaeon]|uniref:protein translocase SEC61 complex subunit gamma n=1 Tax=Methanobrevibacter TaxID=2172 RepID=UPI002A1637BB|nr:protein translocase SEC61 complex subunit gamma [Methanobacteriaceae archaeon]MDD3408014.1 protein translocase SEC61 complex subunit gamma [Methanobacteriaceae archaeon]MDD4593557.1 protein translocase SEC61 complex subunit gamma [Methanobacteriaceae archaeon]